MSLGWPEHTYEARTWHPTPGAYAPRRDRGVRYQVAIPPKIVDTSFVLPAPLAALMEDATVALRSLDLRAGLRHAVPLLRSESAASSRIEQIEVGQRHVGRALAGYKARRSAIDVVANVEALRLAVDRADDETLAPSMSNAVHRALLPEMEWSGRWRRMQNWIGGSNFSPRSAAHVPPPPERVPELMDDLFAFLGRGDVPALAQTAIAHAQFESIHPYPDGNGRTGRALMHVVLKRRGIVESGIAPISVALLADRQRYFDGLNHYRDGDLERWLGFFLRAMRWGARAGGLLHEELEALQGEWSRSDVVTSARSDAVVRSIAADLVRHPVSDASSVAARYGTSREAARRALESLEEAGILRSVSGDRGLRLFEAAEVFEVIDELEAMLRRRMRDEDGA